MFPLAGKNEPVVREKRISASNQRRGGETSRALEIREPLKVFCWGGGGERGREVGGGGGFERGRGEGWREENAEREVGFWR